MKYDHSRKIGNQGDVVKHVVLVNCVEELLRTKGQDEAFVYADSHAGRPVYILPQVGEWRQGVRVVASLKKNDLGRHPSVHLYRHALLAKRMQCGERYFGSSDIVFRTVRQRGHQCHFHLFESNPHAHDDLVRHFFPWKEVILINQTDGYVGVKGIQAASFVLVDPPTLEAKKVRACLSDLAHRGIPFLCWTPRNSSSGGLRQESGKAVRFRDECKVATHFPVRWSDPTGVAQNTFGCCLSVSRDLEGVADVAILSLVELLADKGWKRE